MLHGCAFIAYSTV